jgi:hypothetical protein
MILTNSFLSAARLYVLILLGAIFFHSVPVGAHEKVVVVPLLESTAASPQFRITATDEMPIVGEGRLEYTSDSKPDSRSIWGSVCNHCFEGADNCSNVGFAPKSVSAAMAICNDIGFSGGRVLPDNTSARTDSNFFALDDVVCPDGAGSFSDCSSTEVENCSSGDEVYIECTTTKPRIYFPGFTWSCADGFITGAVPAIPDFDFMKIDDTDPLNPAIVESDFVDAREGDSFRLGVGLIDRGSDQQRGVYWITSMLIGPTYPSGLLISEGDNTQAGGCSNSGGKLLQPDIPQSWSYPLKGINGYTWILSGGIELDASGLILKYSDTSIELRL